MIKIKVNTKEPYEAYVGNIKGMAENLFPSLFGDVKFALICDENVFSLHADFIKNEFAPFNYKIYVFPSGEKNKNLSEYGKIIDFLSENGFDRNDVPVSVGGGVCGDIAGFAAATYMRGVRFVQMPTTLLSAVDSSVGGKTGVNINSGKNLCGAFWQPSLVLCHTPFFETLPKSEITNGMAEVIKYGVIRDKELFEKLEKGIDTEEMIAACIGNKSEIVSADEKEKGIRVILNFGHTAAHAIEKLSDYKISHGEAVAMGIKIMCRASNMPEEEKNRALDICIKYGLSSECPFGAAELAKASRNDKKAEGDFVKVIVPTEIGKCKIEKMNEKQLEKLFCKGLYI